VAGKNIFYEFRELESLHLDRGSVESSEGLYDFDISIDHSLKRIRHPIRLADETGIVDGLFTFQNHGIHKERKDQAKTEDRNGRPESESFHY
jgi:hypothetical protein